MSTVLRAFFLIYPILCLAPILAGTAAAQQGLTDKGRELLRGGGQVTEEGRKRLGLDPGAADQLGPPKEVRVCPAGQSLAGRRCEFASLPALEKALTFNTRVLLGPGTYKECMTVRRNHVTIDGPGAVLSGTACAGKGALVISGGAVTVRGLACQGIAVRDRNGACIRYEGAGLTVDGVRFADSENGILGASGTGDLTVTGSAFEGNGAGGRAHQIYFNRPGDRLVVRDSTFRAARGEGHGIKSGARETILENVVIDGTGGQMSRNVDAYNGGILRITGATLVKAPSDTNDQIIGYDYEARVDHAENEIVVENSRIDCGRGAYVLAGRKSLDTAKVTFRNNTVSGTCFDRARWGL